jgi:release factor glutamine methyltransferase
MKVRQLLKRVDPDLRRDARIILAHLLKVRVAELPLLEEDELDPDVADRFLSMLERRRGGTPVAYLIGEWDFFGRTFLVEEGVLIPRPETEILVERVLELIPKDASWTGLDLGTGTGCIAITLALERKNLRMVGVDLNPRAVDLARRNAEILRVRDRVRILEGDLFEPVGGMVFDFIVSNPPYVPANLWHELPPEVKAEGRLSLLGGEDGTEFFRRIAGRVREFLRPGGFLALEIGHDQGDEVRSLLEGVGLKVNIYKDLSGADRVVLGWS